jgi:hypothetical protein
VILERCLQGASCISSQALCSSNEARGSTEKWSHSCSYRRSLPSPSLHRYCKPAIFKYQQFLPCFALMWKVVPITDQYGNESFNALMVFSKKKTDQYGNQNGQRRVKNLAGPIGIRQCQINGWNQPGTMPYTGSTYSVYCGQAQSIILRQNVLTFAKPFANMYFFPEQ